MSSPTGRTLLLIFSTLLACPWPAFSDVIGGSTSEVVCSFRCNWEGYELAVTRVREGHVITVVRRPQIQYANADRVGGLVGLNPDPGTATVTKVAEGATPLDAYCNYEGFPLRGTIFLLERNVENLYPFDAGATPPLQNSTLCHGRSLNQLVAEYNSIVKPQPPVPSCSYYLRPAGGKAQGCRPVSTTGSSPVVKPMAPRGHTPAQFENFGDLPKDHESCENWVPDGFDLKGKPKYKCLDDWLEGEAATAQPPGGASSQTSSGLQPRNFQNAGSCPGEKAWTPWLDRDNESGTGDFEGLKDFQAAGQACPQPLAIECQTTGGRDWRDAGQRYACEAAKGGFCRNDQNGGRCLDYRVRFLCCRS